MAVSSSHNEMMIWLPQHSERRRNRQRKGLAILCRIASSHPKIRGSKGGKSISLLRNADFNIRPLWFEAKGYSSNVDRAGSRFRVLPRDQVALPKTRRLQQFFRRQLINRLITKWCGRPGLRSHEVDLKEAVDDQKLQTSLI